MEIDELLEEIRLLYDNKEYVQAINLGKKILSEKELTRTEKIIIYQWLLSLHEKQNDYQEIIKNASSFINEIGNEFKSENEIIGYVICVVTRADAYLKNNEVQACVNDYYTIISLYHNYRIENKEYLKIAYQTLGAIQATLANNNVETSKKLLLMAKNSFKEVLKVDGDDIPAHIGLGLIYEKLCQKEKSQNEYHKSMELQMRKYQKRLSEKIVLYKYRQINKYLLKNIKDDMIFLNNPKKFNDPFDCIIFRGRNYKESESFRNVINQIKIFSLSSLRNSILMWSHYADSHKGLCIGYEFDQNYLTEVKANLDVVEYRRTYNRDEYEFKNIFYELYFVKNEIWEYENEFRLITYKGKSFVKSPTIKEVIFGLNTSEKEKRIIRNKLKSIKNIQYYTVIENQTNYMELNIVPAE